MAHNDNRKGNGGLDQSCMSSHNNNVLLEQQILLKTIENCKKKPGEKGRKGREKR